MKLNAYWISGDGINGYTPTAYRKDIMLKDIPESATLRVSAGYRYVFYINGHIVSHGPVRSFVSYKEYDKVDVSSFLKKGRNHLAAISFYSPSCKVENSRDGFIAQIDVDYKTSKAFYITDKSWLFRPAEWYSLSDLRFSKNTELQEHINYLNYPYGWETEKLPEVDNETEILYTPYDWRYNTVCGDYMPVSVLGPVGTLPWVSFSESTISKSVEIAFDPECVWQGNDSLKIYDIADNLAISFQNEKMHGSVVSLKSDFYDNEKSNIFTFDFLKTRSIRPGIIIEEIIGNGRVELYYASAIAQVPCVHRGFGEANEGGVDSITLGKGSINWKALGYKGFRFLTVRIAGNCKIKFKLNSDIIEYPFGESFKPEMKNQILSKLWDIASESIRSSTTDYYVDTCERENCLWTFDACVTGKAAYDTFGETKMWRHSLLSIGKSVDLNGIPMSLAVPGDRLMLLLDQNLLWVHYCLDYYKTTNDLSFIKEIYDFANRLLVFAEKYIDENNLYIPPKYSWHFIDWAEVDRRPYSLPINAIYIMANDAFAKMSEILGKKKNADKFSLIANNVRESSIKFYDYEKGAFLTHIEPDHIIEDYNHFSFRKGSPIDKYAYNIHANALAIVAKIGNEDMQKSSAKHINDMISVSGWMSLGIGYLDLLLSPILDYGYKTTVKDYLERTFARHCNENYPTLGETINSPEYNTAHGWGASVITLIKRLVS